MPFFLLPKEIIMSKADWAGAIWNAKGELVLDIHKNPPDVKNDKNTNRSQHTYSEIDCGGDCGACIALVVDGEVVDGPPFHKNCKCSEPSVDDIDNAEVHESNLGDEVGPNRNSKPDDVKWLKESLHELGFYEPDTRAGESENNLNEYPNQNLFDGINKFQREHNLKERGSVKPGHHTEAKLNHELENQTKQPAEKFNYNGFTFNGPINHKDGQYAVFDGKSLTVYEDSEKVAEWGAVSGKEGFQSPEYQDKKSTGPLPKGAYVARKKDFQSRSDYGPIKRYTSWPGGQDSWGNHRGWLEPASEKNTLGRSGFSIHGGKEPGSQGCIDLTSGMDGFADWFKNNGKDLILYVTY